MSRMNPVTRRERTPRNWKNQILRIVICGRTCRKIRIVLCSLLGRLWTIVYVFPAKQCRATRMWPLWVILIMRILVTLAVIQIWAPEHAPPPPLGSPIAVCYDCLCLVYLLRTMRSLFYDGDGALEWTGHSEADGCALVGIYTAVFALAAGCEWDDAISNEVQRTGMRHDA